MSLEGFGRSVGELLDDDYFFTQKFTFKCRNESDMCLGGEAEFGSVSPMANLSVSRPGSFLSLDRLRVKSDGRVLAEASLKTSEFSKLTVSAEDGRQEPGKPQPSFGKLGCQIKVPDTLTCNADIDVVNGPILRGSAVYVYNQVLAIGTQAVINTRLEESPKDFAPEVTDLSMSIAYQGPNWSLAVKSLDVFGGIKLEYLQKIPPKLAIGSSIVYNFQQGQQKAQQKLAFGVEYNLAEGSKMKCKIDSSATISTSLRHRLSPAVDLTVCGEINAQDWSAESHKFGIGLDFDF